MSRAPSAREWTERIDRDVRAYAPDLIWVEVANALRLAERANALSAARSDELLEAVIGLPIHVRSTRTLCRHALRSALATGLTAYDASYLVLAEVFDATLVTADRQLAAAASRAELIA